MSTRQTNPTTQSNDSTVKHSTVKHLIELLEEAISLIPRGPVAISFSGGVDSTVLARLLEDRARLYAVGMLGSQDLDHAIRIADAHGWDILPVVLTVSDMDAILSRLVPLIREPTPMNVNFHLPLFVASRSAVERIVVAGHGADEIFGGYDRYRRMTPEEFEKATRSDYESLWEGDLEDARNIVESTGHVLVTPYMFPTFAEAVLSLPYEEKMSGDGNKLALRKIASALGLEEEAWRDKKAAQFGSKTSLLLKMCARERGLSEKELVDSYRSYI